MSGTDRWPLAPVLRAVGAANMRELADMLGVKHNRVRNWSSMGLSIDQADSLAIALDLHPSHVWPTFYDDVDLDAVEDLDAA